MSLLEALGFASKKSIEGRINVTPQLNDNGQIFGYYVRTSFGGTNYTFYGHFSKAGWQLYYYKLSLNGELLDHPMKNTPLEFDYRIKVIKMLREFKL
jgi:hypothetical protein